MNIIDLHCDTISALESSGQRGDLAANRLHVDIKKLTLGGSLLQVFALFVDMREYPDVYGRCRRLLDRFLLEMKENQDQIGLVTTYSGLLENKEKGKLSALLSIEEGEAHAKDLERLQEFYEQGVRMATLTWNYRNTLAAPNHLPDYEEDCLVMSPDEGGGLTPKGYLFVEEMERLSMMLDVSHLGDKGIYDVLSHTKGPVLASHSNARKLCPHVRNLPDRMIRAIAERGGIIGVNFYPPFLEENAFKSTVDRILAHISYLRNVGGIRCVSLGSDFDGMDGELEIADASKMQLLVRAMEKKGFSSSDIERICYKNAMDFMERSLPGA